MIRTSWYNGGLEKKIGVWQCGDSETGKIIYKGTSNTMSINEHLVQGLRCTPRTKPNECNNINWWVFDTFIRTTNWQSIEFD